MTTRRPPAGATPPVIADLVEVAAVETVVRLDGRPGRLGELVVTDDVAAVLGEVFAALPEGPGVSPEIAAGGAFFLVAHFGAGKSHVLAALAELFGESPEGRRPGPGPAGWPAGLAAAAASRSPGLAVAVPLVEYRAGAALEDVVLARAYAALGRPAPPAGTDRRAAWDGLAATAADAGRPGVVVLLDELSEFLRAKQQPELTEDLRFLQFLGEWCRGRSVLVVAALQESIEEVANVSQRELARIRDRYRTLTLSMRHVEDLVRGRLVHVRPGAEPLVERAHAELESAFPGWGVPRERFCACYPVHPATLAVLEGLRFLFSQQRGVVDFVCRQLAGDAPAGIPAWRERPWLQLLTPDRVYDHFATRLGERVETRRLAEHVVPYWERAVAETFDAEADRELALRAVKLLCLLAASPLERPRTAAELAHLLLTRVSALDPAANIAYVESAILGPLVARGAYVVALPAEPGGAARYTVEVEADAAVLAGARVRAARAELHPGDRRITGTLFELGSSPSLPLQLLAEVGPARRELLWHNTLRSLVVGPARLSELDTDDVRAAVGSARDAGAEGALLVAEPEPGPPAGGGRSGRPRSPSSGWAERAEALVAGTDRLAVWVPAPLTGLEREVALELHARRVVLEATRAEGLTGPGDVVEFLERARETDAPRARELLQRAYFAGTVVYGEGADPPDLASLSGLPFDRALAALADPLLSRLHPRHREVAPHGELVGERLLRQLVTEAVPLTRVSASAAERGQLRSLIGGYLVPLGLFRQQRDAFVLAPDPVRSPAVAETLRLVPGVEPVPAAEVVAHLAAGPVGLTEPEALLVLNACVQAGLLEAWRGRRRHSEPFLAVTAGDRLSAGELLDPPSRAALAALGPVVGTGPLEPWNASLQRTLWERARAWLEVLREDCAQARSGLAALAGAASMADAGADGDPRQDGGPAAEAAADIERIAAVVEAVDTALSPVDGLRALAGAVGDADATLRSARRLAGVARFLREQLTRAQQALGYLAHPRLHIPPDETRLVALRDVALRLGGRLLELAADDRAGEFSAAERSFRDAYAGAYAAAHTRFYGSAAVRQAEAVRASGPYQALAALAGLEAVAVPDDRVKLDRALMAAVPAPCDRRLDLELAWKPRCGCGFALGQDAPTLDVDGLVAQARRGVEQYRAELGRPENRSRLSAAVDDLVALDRADVADDLRRLLALVVPPLASGGGRLPGADRGAEEAEEADTTALARLLVEPLASVVRDVLGGAHLVVQRDLSVLREDLIGRRYPKRRLLDLIARWIDPTGEVPDGGFVEVVDRDDALRAAARSEDDGPPPPGSPWPRTPGTGAGATAAFCALRFPSLAALLPGDRPAEAFWLAAWWAGTSRHLTSGEPASAPPPWIPAELVADPPLLLAAAEAATADLGARADLAELDARVNGESLLGDQVASVVDLAHRRGAELADILGRERLLRHPLRLAADEIVRRLAGDPQLADRLAVLDLGATAAGHALVASAEFESLVHLLAAARHLAELERRLPAAGGRDLVEDVYPAAAPVPGLLSRAEVASVAGSLVSTDAIDALRRAGRRLLGDADAAFSELADAGFPGCLRIWEVGRGVVAPLLRTEGRVAVLLVDAMRVDLWHHLRPRLVEALPGRRLREAFAVVPAPTRTAEAVAALYLGRPVPAGSAPTPPSEAIPFAHLGVEARAVIGVDRDRAAAELRDLWANGPKLSVAVATGVDEALHRATAELCELLDAAAGSLQRRVVPTLAALPASVPLVVTADHGFREIASWGGGSGGRYAHGGCSLEEGVVPVATFGPVDA